ncbi:MAG: DUF547 domain-containing protein [Pseudomonadales bacterium]|nr:DUF547 domain-containing protein [Pseudomonadales bacterium]
MHPPAPRTLKPATTRRRFLNLSILVACALALPGHAAFNEGQALDLFRPDAGGDDDPFDHGPWQDFLDRYLVTDTANGIHLVRYGAVSAEDRRSLDAWLEALAGTDPRGASRDAQMAYWINLYNGLTVQLILEHPEVESIREISSGLFSFGPWDLELTRVAGQDLTLNDIEHRILRPLYRDPRIHFAVNCASLGCPDLAAEAYTATNLEALLERGARTYVNHPRGVTLEGRRLTLSSIFDWYRGDFPSGRAALLAWLADYAEPELGAALRAFDGRLRHAYDWNLNAAR